MARRYKLLSPDQHQRLRQDLEEISRMVSGLIRTLQDSASGERLTAFAQGD
jgi:hypothetical protein